MSNLIVLPTVLPALTAAFLLLAVRYDLKRQRLISVAATAALLALAIVLYGMASDGAPRPYRLGDWPAPFGIVLVLDRLSATMLVLAAAAGAVRRALRRQWLGRARAALPPAVPVPAARYQRRLSDRRYVQPVRLFRGDADRVLRAAAAWRRPAPAAGGVSVRHDQPARLDAVPVRGRADLRRRSARSTWPISRSRRRWSVRPTRRCCAPAYCCCFSFSRSRRRSCRCTGGCRRPMPPPRLRPRRCS